MGETLRLAAERLDGSEITTVPPHMVGLSEALLAENIDPRDLRGATTRNGRDIISGSTSLGSNVAIDGLKAWTRNNGTSYVIIRASQKFYSASASLSTLIENATGAVDAIFTAAPLNEKLVIAVDGAIPLKYVGGAAPPSMTALGGSPPSLAKYAVVFVSKIFLAGDTANPQTKTFSKTNDPEDYTAADDAGSITTQSGGGDTIQGLAANNKVLLTFYRNFVDVLIGDSTFNFREERLLNRGLVSQTGHKSIGEVVFFASDEAVYMVSGTTISDITSARIRKAYNDIPDKSKISLGVKGDLLLVVDYGTDRAYACAYKYGRWAEWTGQSWRVMDTANDQTLYGGHDGGSTTQVYKLDSGSTDMLSLTTASTITASWRTGNFGFGWEDAIKNLRDVRIHAKPGMGTVTITYYKNGASYGSTNEVTFGTAGDHDWAGKVGQNAVRGQFIGFKASWVGAGTLYGWALYAEISTMRGDTPLEV